MGHMGELHGLLVLTSTPCISKFSTISLIPCIASLLIGYCLVTGGGVPVNLTGSTPVNNPQSSLSLAQIGWFCKKAYSGGVALLVEICAEEIFMLVDSEDMSKVRFICLRRSMPKIAPVFNGAHSNFVVRVFGPNCTSMGGVSYKTESSPITPVKQSLVFLYGMFKPCANFVGITVISAPVSSKKSISFSFMLPFTKFFGHCVGLQGKGSYSQPQ